MPWYSTSYRDPENGHAYGAEIWARNDDEAIHACQLRSIGERAGPWDGQPQARASDMLARFFNRRVRKKPALGEIIHALTWLAYLATAAKVCTSRAALCDGGWLHEAVHWLGATYKDVADQQEAPMRAKLVERVRAVEVEVPGYVEGWRLGG